MMMMGYERKEIMMGTVGYMSEELSVISMASCMLMSLMS